MGKRCDDEDPAYTVVDEVTKGNMHAVSSNAVAEAIEDEYSTTEVKTNKVWIDGRPIYRKVVDTGALPNSTTKTVAHGLTNVREVVSIAGIAYGENAAMSLPFVLVGASG